VYASDEVLPVDGPVANRRGREALAALLGCDQQLPVRTLVQDGPDGG
jgi:hypothetical protein